MHAGNGILYHLDRPKTNRTASSPQHPKSIYIPAYKPNHKLDFWNTHSLNSSLFGNIWLEVEFQGGGGIKTLDASAKYAKTVKSTLVSYPVETTVAENEHCKDSIVSGYKRCQPFSWDEQKRKECQTNWDRVAICRYNTTFQVTKKI